MRCGAHAAVTIITLDHGDVGALILVHSAGDSAFTGPTQHWPVLGDHYLQRGNQYPVLGNDHHCSNVPQCIMARKWRVVSPSALCLLNYNFLFRGLNLSQCPSRGREGAREQAQDDCESVARSIVCQYQGSDLIISDYYVLLR